MMEVIEESRDFAPISMKMTTLLDVEQVHDALHRYAPTGYDNILKATQELEKIINKYGGRLRLT